MSGLASEIERYSGYDRTSGDFDRTGLGTIVIICIQDGCIPSASLSGEFVPQLAPGLI